MYPPADPFAALMQCELDERRSRAAEERLARFAQREARAQKAAHTYLFRRPIGAALLRLGLIVAGLPTDRLSLALGTSGRDK
jgi:hypothetical protein